MEEKGENSPSLEKRGIEKSKKIPTRLREDPKNDGLVKRLY